MAAAPHNIFSDTELGGKLTFRQLPADGGASFLHVLGLGAPSGGLADTLKFTSDQVQLFLGIAGNQYEYAFFGSNNAISSGSQLKRDAGGTNLYADANLTLLANRNFFLTTLTAAGTTPANLKVAVFDGTQLKTVNPPTITTGKVYYFRIGANGFEWNEQDPGGGGTPAGVTGSGTSGFAAKWNGPTDLTTSTLEFTSTGAIEKGNFEIQPSGEKAFSFTYTITPLFREWYVNKNYLPLYATPIPAAASAVFNDTDIMKRADASYTRAWLGVYTTTQVDNLLTGYLRTTGGTLTGDLLISKDDPVLRFLDTTGDGIGECNVSGGLVWFKYDRVTGNQVNLMDLDSLGNLYLTQSGAHLMVATQLWTTNNFSPLGHKHAPSDITMTKAALVGGSAAGSATEITMGAGMQLVGSALSTTALVSNVGLSMPSQFSVSPSSITTSGTFDVAWVTVGTNFVLAGPTAGTGAPAFRKLVMSDIDTSALGTGTPTGAKFLRDDRTWQTVSGGGGISYPGTASPYVANSSGWRILSATAPISVVDAGSTFDVRFDATGFAKISASALNRIAYWDTSTTLGITPLEMRGGNFVATASPYAFAIDDDQLWVAGRRFPMPPIDPPPTGPRQYAFRAASSTSSQVWGAWEPVSGGSSMPEPNNDGEPYVRVVTSNVGAWKKLVGDNRWL